MSDFSSARIWAIVPAAGIGSRMQSGTPKQYLPLLDATVLDITLAKLLSLPQISGVVLALGEDDPHWPASKYAQHQKVHTVIGGKERSDSVLAGLNWCQQQDPQAPAWALVHDAARPCVALEKIRELIALCFSLNAQVAGAGRLGAKSDDVCGAILAAPAADTIKRVVGKRITGTEDRSQLWLAHTPQMFPVQVLRQALVSASKAGLAVTDEASAIEAFGGGVMIVSDRRDNIKITVPEDLIWAHTILQRQGATA